MRNIIFTVRVIVFLAFASQAIMDVEAREKAFTKEVSNSHSGNDYSLTACRARVLEHSEFGHKDDILHSITEVNVVMVPLQPNFGKAVSMNDIKAAIEKKCRSSGLRISGGHNPKTPVLTAQVFRFDGERDGQLAYVVKIELREMTIMARDMKSRVLSSLYEYESLVCIGQLQDGQAEIKKDLLESVDHFITEWKRENRN